MALLEQVAKTDNPPATLLKLPAEMQCLIASHAEDGDIAALRLTSRELRAAALDTFRDRFFTSRKHLYTMDGLQTLVDITTPSSLGLCANLKEIVLVPFRIDHKSGSYAREEDYSEEREDDAFYARDVVGTSDVRGQDYPSGIIDIEFLTTLFNNLGEQNIAPKFCIDSCLYAGNFKSMALCHGFTALKKLLGPGAAHTARPREYYDSSHFIRRLNQASAQSSWPMRSFDLDGNMLAFIEDKAFHVPGDLEYRAWSRLTALEIDLDGIEQKHGRPTSFFFGTGVNLAALIASAVELQSLTVTLVPKHPHDSLGFLLEHLKSTYLRILRMSFYHGPLDLPRDFLTKHKENLEEVSLGEFDLPDLESWVAILRVLLEECTGLRKITIYRMSVAALENVLEDKAGTKFFEFEGRDEVRAGLEYLVEQFEQGGMIENPQEPEEDSSSE